VTGSTTLNDYDVFVFRVDPTGANLLYNFVFGGTGKDLGQGIAVDTAGNAHVTGYTGSADFPTVNGCQLALLGIADAFVTTISPAPAIAYSTYLGGDAGGGGAGTDQGNAIAVDSSGITYVTGMTTSRAATLGCPIPGPPIQPDCAINGLGNCDGDAFAAKFDTTQSGAASLLFFTYHGGSNAETGNGIAVDPSGNAYIAGYTNSTDLPVGGGPFQPSYGGGNTDAFVTKYDPTASTRVYSSYLGGTGADLGFGIAVDRFENAFVVGETCSTNFPTSRPLQPAQAGNCDAFVAKVLVGPDLRLSASTLDFGTLALGTSSTPQTVIVTSSGDASLSISNVDVTGGATDFSRSSTCLGTLPNGTNCAIEVTFTPTAIGPRTGTITVDSDAPGGPHFIQLQGTGGTFGVSPLALVFGDQGLGTASAAQQVTVTNTGTVAVTIFGIDASGDFTQNNDCGNSLAGGASCLINVTFTPTAAGIRSGAITITDGYPTSPQTITLTGHGVSPTVSLSAVALSFPDTDVGAVSAAMSVTVTNIGNAALLINNIATTGDFGKSDQCGASLLAGASCMISVTFAPTEPGNRYGTLTVTSNGSGSPHTVLLAGNGLGVGPAVSLSAAALSFPDTGVGVTSAALTVTLSNTGNADLLINSIATTGDFTKSDQCGASVAAGANCVISITFTPTEVGNRYGTLVLTSNAAGSPHTVLLAGNGLPIPTVRLFPTSLTFGDQAVNTTSLPQTVSLTNIGGAPLAITSVTITGANGGDFAPVVNTCTGTFAPGAGCTISVTFTPSAEGARIASVSVVDDAPDSPQSVALSGNGVLPPGIGFNPTSLTFPAQAVGTSSAPQTVTLTNTGGGPLTITSIEIQGTNSSDFFRPNTTCGSTIAPGASCTIDVIFTPTASGNRLASLTVSDNAVGSPHSVPLFGGGSSAAGDFILSADPASVTVFAGDPATYTLAVTPVNDFSSKVTLACSVTITQGSCAVDPTSVTPTGTEPVTATVRVLTTARVMAPPTPGPKDLLPPAGMRWMPWLLALMMATMVLTARRRTALVLAAMMTVILIWSACGGGGTTAGVPRGTPVGNYTVTITATSGTTVKTTAVTVTVN
jgi:hypothetical protein